MNIELGRILIVDDDRMQRMLLTRTLAQQGHTVQSVGSGHEALNKLRTEPFDIVLCDITMPDMDGFQVLEQIMGDEMLKQIPVVMVSGFGEMTGIVSCIEMGAADYIHKPADPALLRARVENCLVKKRWLEREIALRHELEQRYCQLQELEQLRDSLTNMIVHDLRTPLTSFLTGLQTLEYVGELNPDQQECLALSIDGGNTLLGMINDLLDISKMESGSLKLELGIAQVQQLGTHSMEQVTSLARAKELNLVSEVAANLPVLQADVEKLSRTLVNLMGNAIKFTPTFGTITLSAFFVPRPGRTDSFVFCVSDTGEGIPQEAFERIFEKFGQVEDRQAGRTLSTGLGLTFCKMVVEAHGGRIWVESEPGQGSQFFFALPIRSSAHNGSHH
ncbi:adaptive-response sensory-kinase SasA [Abditibacteriota bacterium]|nr:adaptive-response sensory-kinase SasA [Abditibacteriota bacterium]